MYSILIFSAVGLICNRGIFATRRVAKSESQSSNERDLRGFRTDYHIMDKSHDDYYIGTDYIQI